MRLVSCLTVVFCITTVGAQDYLEDVSIVRAILDSNDITGVSIESITRSEEGRIRWLDLSSKDVAESFVKRVPPAIGGLTELRYLALAHNGIERLPEEIGRLTELRELNLGNNALTSLPQSMKNLTKLEKLDLRNNDLEQFPSQILGCKNLWYLHLRNNTIPSLPANFSSLSSLKELYMQGNELKSLPADLPKMNLEYVELIENRLCDLPPALDSWMKKKDEKYLDWQQCW